MLPRRPLSPRPATTRSRLVGRAMRAGASARPAATDAAAGAPFVVPPPPADLDAHVEAAWTWWRGLGAPKLHVAPMVDQVGGWVRGGRDCGAVGGGGRGAVAWQACASVCLACSAAAQARARGRRARGGRQTDPAMERAVAAMQTEDRKTAAAAAKKAAHKAAAAAAGRAL